MVNPEKTYVVRHPGFIKFMLLMSFLLITMDWELIRGDSFLTVFQMVWSLFILTGMGIMTIRRFSKNAVSFHDHEITRNDKRTFDAARVQSVFLHGNRIGMKLKGRKIVPLDLYFTFPQSNRNDGMKELQNWAARNGIAVQYRFFTSWI